MQECSKAAAVFAEPPADGNGEALFGPFDHGARESLFGERAQQAFAFATGYQSLVVE